MRRTSVVVEFGAAVEQRIVGRWRDAVRSWTALTAREQVAADAPDAEPVAVAAAAVGSTGFRVDPSSTLVRVSACTAHLIRRGRSGRLLDVGVAQPHHTAGHRKLEQRPLRDPQTAGDTDHRKTIHPARRLVARSELVSQRSPDPEHLGGFFDRQQDDIGGPGLERSVHERRPCTMDHPD